MYEFSYYTLMLLSFLMPEEKSPFLQLRELLLAERTIGQWLESCSEVGCLLIFFCFCFSGKTPQSRCLR